MRIAFVTETWLPSHGGVVTRLVNCVPMLSRLGHEVVILAPTSTGRLFGPARVIEIPRVDVAVQRREIDAILESLRIDVIHVIKPMSLGWTAARYASDHGVPLAMNLAGWAAGVDLELFRPRLPEPGSLSTIRRSNARLCLYVGGFAPAAAAGRMVSLARTPGFQVLFAGGGPERPTFEALFADASVDFLGPMLPCGVARAHAIADVLVFPGSADSEPLAVIEAMASGMPVVAADSAVSRSLLQGYEGGWLFPVASPDTLPAVVEFAIRNSPSRSELARCARARLISWEQSTDQLMDLHRAALRKQSAIAS